MRHSTAKVFEEVHRKLLARNTTVQLPTQYTNPEFHNTQFYRQTAYIPVFILQDTTIYNKQTQ